MLFYGYVDNGESFIRVKITAESATAAYEKLQSFATKLQEKRSDFSFIECLMLRNENNENICQSHIDDVNKCLAEYDGKFQHSVDEKIGSAVERSVNSSCENSTISEKCFD